MADGSGVAGYLGVTRSLSGRAWRERPHDFALARRHALTHGLPDPLARALAARGVSEADAERFLSPTLKGQFPDPSSFLDMDAAAEIIVDAALSDQRCVVFADYDVDGAASAAQLVRWFRAMGRDLGVYVPDRMIEGYGPSPAAFRHLKADGADLVITVDCGAAAHEALEAAAEAGLRVVVIDHHLMRGETAPPAAALVNPNRPGCNSGQGNLAAAGVVFVLLAALNREARRRGAFADRPEPDLRAWLDLAGAGRHLRRHRAHRLQPRPGDAGAEGDVRLEQSRARGPAGRGGDAARRGDRPSTRAMCSGPGSMRGVASVGSDLGTRLLATDDREEADAPRRPARRAEHRTQGGGGRGPGSRRRPDRRWAGSQPIPRDRRRRGRLASRRGRHRRRAAEGAAIASPWW